VVQKLGWVDSGIKEDRLFIARWGSSGSGWVWAVGGQAGGGSFRDWTVHNYLVEFDEAGTVKNACEVPTAKLFAKLQQYVAQSGLQTAEFHGPAELKVTVHRVWTASTTAKLFLSPDSFSFQDLGKPKHNFAVHPSAIEKITLMVDDKEGKAPDVSLIRIDVQLKEKTPVGKHATFLISPPDLLALIKYLHVTNGTPHAP